MNSTDYSYWKRPWYKWLTLAAGLVQLPSLWINLRNLPTDPELRLQCALNILLAVCFLGEFLIGTLSRSAKAAHLAESILFLFSALLWSISCAALHLFGLNITGFLAVLLLILALFSSGCRFRLSRKE